MSLVFIVLKIHLIFNSIITISVFYAAPFEQRLVWKLLQTIQHWKSNHLSLTHYLLSFRSNITAAKITAIKWIIHVLCFCCLTTLAVWNAIMNITAHELHCIVWICTKLIRIWCKMYWNTHYVQNWLAFVNDICFYALPNKINIAKSTSWILPVQSNYQSK